MNFNEKINNVKFEMSKCNLGHFNELITYGCELYKNKTQNSYFINIYVKRYFIRKFLT